MNVTRVYFSAIFLVLIMYFQYYIFYFLEFEYGATKLPSWYFMVKIFAVFIAIGYFSNFKDKYDLKQILLFLFVLASLVIFFIKGVYSGFNDLKYLNTVLCVAPIAFLGGEQRDKIIIFLNISVFALIIQIGIDFYIYSIGASLWENKAFIGGFGNASSFGLICNVLVAYVLFIKNWKFKYFFVAALASGVFMSSSLAGFFCLGLIFVFWCFSRGFVFVVVTSVVVMSFLFMSYEFFLSDHALHKLKALLDFGGGEVESRSISMRADMHSEYFKKFLDSPLEMVLWGVDDRAYYFFDSQILTYLGSFGLLLSLLFWCYIATAIYYAYRSPREVRPFFVLTITIFCMMLFSNRMLDYFPMPFLFFLLVEFSKVLTISNRRDLVSKRV